MSSRSGGGDGILSSRLHYIIVVLYIVAVTVELLRYAALRRTFCGSYREFTLTGSHLQTSSQSSTGCTDKTV